MHGSMKKWHLVFFPHHLLHEKDERSRHIDAESNDTSSDVLMCITKHHRTEKGLEISEMLTPRNQLSQSMPGLTTIKCYGTRVDRARRLIFCKLKKPFTYR
jgi:hypothetical protein